MTQAEDFAAFCQSDSSRNKLTERDILAAEMALRISAPDNRIHQALMDLRNQFATLETCERLYKKHENLTTVQTAIHSLNRIKEIAAYNLNELTSFLGE